MNRPRIVVDTNAVVSAALRSLGWEARLIKLIAYHGVQLWASVEVLAEYREVLNRPKFAKLDRDHVSRLLTLVGEEAVILVTGNIRHFTKNYKNTQVVTARQLLELAEGRTTM